MQAAAGRLNGFLRRRIRSSTAWGSGLLKSFDYLKQPLRNFYAHGSICLLLRISKFSWNHSLTPLYKLQNILLPTACFEKQKKNKKLLDLESKLLINDSLFFKKDSE